MRIKKPKRQQISDLPRSTPAELMRVLIDPMHALVLVVEGTAADALANATRQIGEMDRDGLGHLACRDILTALAELDLRARQIAPEKIAGLRTTADAIEEARRALAAAERAHVRAKAEVLAAIGYHDKVEALRRSTAEAEASP